MKRRHLIRLCVIFLIFIISYQAYSLPRHSELTNFSIAIKMQLHSGTDFMLELMEYYKRIQSWNEKEDWPPWKTSNHFWDPKTDAGLEGQESAKDRASEYYKKALDLFSQGDESKAWEYFSIALHLLQDMGAPSHVHDAVHFCHSVVHTGYEAYVDDNWDSWISDYLQSKFNEMKEDADKQSLSSIEDLMNDLANSVYDYPYDEDGKHHTNNEQNADTAKETLGNVI